LRRAQRGDERAVAAIVRMYEAIVFNYVLRLVGDRALAEDLSQEIFLGVYQALPRFSGRSTFTTWLFELTKNRVLDEMRAAARRSGRVTGTAEFRVAGAAASSVERLELVGAVWRAVDALNLEMKMALLLRDVVGLSYAEIAESLQITLTTVKWRIHESRRAVLQNSQHEGLLEEPRGNRAAVRAHA